MSAPRQPLRFAPGVIEVHHRPALWRRALRALQALAQRVIA